jgi:hypothetical protein
MLHFFDEVFQQRYIHVINLTEQMLIFYGQQIKDDIKHGF